MPHGSRQSMELGAGAERVQMEESERVKKLEKQQYRAVRVNPGERNML
jgi:hypothetical protein